MKKVLDVKTLDCPQPVIETKKLLEDDSITTLEVLVGNMTAKENVKRLANSMGLENTISEIDGGFSITISKDGATVVSEKATISDGKTYLILSDSIGDGEAELGKLLMKSLIYTLTQTSPYPKAIYLLNSGVKLSTQNEEIITHLKELSELGTEVFSCGTCLNFYNLAEELKVGAIGNMYDVVEGLSAGEVITIA